MQLLIFLLYFQDYYYFFKNTQNKRVMGCQTKLNFQRRLILMCNGVESSGVSPLIWPHSLYIVDMHLEN